MAAWLDEIEARLAAAKPGEWTGDGGNVVRIGGGGICYFVAEEHGAPYDGSDADAAFVAAAPADLRRLLAVARAAEATGVALDLVREVAPSWTMPSDALVDSHAWDALGLLGRRLDSLRAALAGSRDDGR